MVNNEKRDPNEEVERGNLTAMEAFQKVYKILESLEEETRERVFASVATMLGIGGSAARLFTPPKIEEMPGGKDEGEENDEDSFEYDSFAELYATANPNLNHEKALVAAYWIQVCQGAENFSGFLINKELTNLGHRLPNVTNALSSLINMKPQLVLQLKKTGKTPQARKTYKLSKSGIDKVEEMISG